MQKHPDGSVTLNPSEVAEHQDTMTNALTILQKGSEVARRQGNTGLFGSEHTQSVFLLDVSSSMDEAMDGAFGVPWNISKMAHLHELMRSIMEEVQPMIVCFGFVPEAMRTNNKLNVIMEGDRAAQFHGAFGMEASPYGAWVSNSLQVKPRGGTPLWCALQLAINRGWTDVTVISDGHPQEGYYALELARQFSRIDAWFLGDGDSLSVRQGRAFMEKLHRGAGTFGVTNLADENVRRRLSNSVAGYLLGYGTGG